MKRFTKYFALVLTVAMCLAMLATPASAVAVVAREKTGAATTFDNSWEFSVDVTCLGIDVGVLIYGFNTAWIDEDYVWTKAFVFHCLNLVHTIFIRFRNGFKRCSGTSENSSSFCKNSRKIRTGQHTKITVY